MAKKYIKPQDVSPSEAEKVLDFLNTAKTAEEIADAIEFPGERDVGIKVAQNILDKREELGGFKDLKQVDDVLQVGPERFTEIVIALEARKEEQMKREESVEYVIRGQIDPEDLKRVPKEVPIRAYAVQDRRVVGSAPIEKGGRFEVKYEYKVFGKDRKAYGAHLIIGPDLPGDEILKTKLKRRFLSSKEFKSASPEFKSEIAEPIKLSEEFLVDYAWVITNFINKFTYTGFIFTCAPLIPPGGWGGCYSPQALSDEEAFIRLSKGDRIIAEGIELDVTGKFEFTQIWFHSDKIYLLCGNWVYGGAGHGVSVEVYQKIGSQEYTLYQGVHDFEDNIAKLIFIDREETYIIPPLPDPTPAVETTFRFDRIGNIPAECIFKEGDPDLPGVEFIGYVDSSGARPGIELGAADLKVKDYAFGGVVYLFANLGEGFGTPYAGGVDMSQVTVKYFRIRCSYIDPVSESTIVTWLDTPFNNTRRIAAGGTTAEFMGPFTTHPVSGATVDPFYVYPNPYDTDPNKDWKYRGLVMVLNTNNLPLKYRRYTFTIEPLDSNLNPLGVISPQECVLTMLVDNDVGMALTLAIEDIMGVSACEVLNLDSGFRDITVPFSINDTHGNLLEFSLTAWWGDKGRLLLVPSDAFAEANQYSRGVTPSWKGGSYSLTKNHNWVQCAYQFRLIARRRVTNGFHHQSSWKEFNKHITILHP